MEVLIVDKFDFERFDDQRYPLSYIFRDALILLTPTVLMLLGVLILA